MKFLHKKIGIGITIVMCGLCLTAIGISIRVTKIAIERQNQVIKSMDAETSAPVYSSRKQININKIADFSFFYNGQKIENISAYSTDNRQSLIPIDEIYKQVGQSCKYYSSDDIFEWGTGSNKLMIKLGKNEAWLGGNEIRLPVCPVSAKGHILVPVELLSNFAGYQYETNTDQKAVFVNYYPEYMDGINSNIKVARLINGTAGISDIFNKTRFWDRQGNPGSNESIIRSASGSTSILKSSDSLYILKYSGRFSPRKTSIDLSATLSADGRYLYWTDKNEDSSFIYDIGSSKTKIMNNYSSAMNTGNESSNPFYAHNIIFDYKEGYRYRRISFTNSANIDNYTFIERNGSTVIEGSVNFSPNKYKVLYLIAGQGYYVSNSDGSEVTFLGQGLDAEWVNNARIILQTQNNKYIFDRSGKNKTETYSSWKKVGQVPDGGVLFTRDNTLYVEYDGTEYSISDLPGTCEYAYAASSGGPYVAACSGASDGVYYIEDNKIAKVGKYTSLLNTTDSLGTHTDYRNSFSTSPDNKSTVLFQKENGFVTMTLIKKNSTEQHKLVLNDPVDKTTGTATIQSRWIGNNRLLIFTSSRGWIVNISDNIKIYNWVEDASNSIEDIIP